jgi:hypothetical protein
MSRKSNQINANLRDDWGSEVSLSQGTLFSPSYVTNQTEKDQS